MIIPGSKPDRWVIECDGCGAKSAEVTSPHKPSTITIEGWKDVDGLSQCPACVDRAQSSSDDDDDDELDV